jgi:hypothetical protein
VPDHEVAAGDREESSLRRASDLWGRYRALSRAAQYNAIAVDRDVVNLTTLVNVAIAYFLA